MTAAIAALYFALPDPEERSMISRFVSHLPSRWHMPVYCYLIRMLYWDLKSWAQTFAWIMALVVVSFYIMRPVP